MRTIKPISTISFNTKDYLLARLDDLLAAECISFYSVILHYAEEDETKDHFHVYVQPNGRIDTDRLREALVEPVPGEHKPLGCLPIVSSKFVEWYLYGLHDKDYLATKGQTRKYHYRDDDFINSNDDVFVEFKYTSDFSKFKTRARIREMAQSGIPFHQLVNDGFIPINQIFQFREFYNNCLVAQEVTNRGVYLPHDEI